MKAKEFLIKENTQMPKSVTIPGIDMDAKDPKTVQDPSEVTSLFQKIMSINDKAESLQTEASYPGNLGMMEMFKFKQVATPEQWKLMKSLIALKEFQKAWELLQKVTNTKLHEAEEDTSTSKEIVKTLKNAGYKIIGSGADSTVWNNDTGNVVKILMPDSGGTQAAETFKKFAEFCSQHQNLKSVPKFLKLNNKIVNDFSIQGRDYQMIVMEKLFPIKTDSFEEAMVWYLSDYATKNISWEKVKEQLSYPDAWANTEFQKYAEKLADKVYNLSSQEEKDLKELYNVMTFLYLKGQINKLGWDLHTENIMQRKNGDLVIIDPWFEMNRNSK